MKITVSFDKMKEDKGVSPLETFVSALAGCVGVYAKRYLDRHNIIFKRLIINAEAEFKTESPVMLDQIKVGIDTDADLGEKKEVFLRFLAGCPVHNTIVHTKAIEIELAKKA